jgi:putative cell wall-binding protein
MVYEEQGDNSNGSDNGSSGHLSIDSRKLARSLGSAPTAAGHYTRTVIASAAFALCVSSFAGNYVQHLQYQRIATEKQKLEDIAENAQITTLNHVRKSFDKKIIEMSTDDAAFRAAVTAATKRLESE